MSKEMKLIMEKWRRFNEETERTQVQKLSQLFLRNAHQAIHLSEELDEFEIVGVMKAALRDFHHLMRLYIQWTEAYQAGEYETKSRGHLYQDYIIVTQYIENAGKLPIHRDYIGPAPFPLIQF